MARSQSPEIWIDVLMSLQVAQHAGLGMETTGHDGVLLAQQLGWKGALPASQSAGLAVQVVLNCISSQRQRW
jgi:hypothetical protein